MITLKMRSQACKDTLFQEKNLPTNGKKVYMLCFFVLEGCFAACWPLDFSIGS